MKLLENALTFVTVTYLMRLDITVSSYKRLTLRVDFIVHIGHGPQNMLTTNVHLWLE